MRLRDCYLKRDGQWQALEDWVQENSEAHEWLKALLDWRRKAVSGSLRLPEWFGILKELNREQKLPWVTLENKGGLMDERDRRALNQMERLLVNHISVDDVTQSSSMSLKEFVALCEKLWTDGDVSIPFAENGVRVTSDPNVIGDVDHLFVLGMLEGVFPRRRSEDPILTDVERAEISALRPDQPPLPDSRSKAQAERDEFYRVCAAANRSIVFSYPLADDQKDNIPAFYLSEVERAHGKIESHNYPRPELAPAIEKCLAEADINLRRAYEGPRESPLAIGLESEPARSAIRPSIDAAFQPNVLRDALQCPFQYLARHVLKVRVKRQPARWSTLRRLPQVSQLLTKDDMADAERAMIIALDSQLDLLYAEVPEWEMRLLRAGGQRLIRDWLQRESRSREQWPKTSGSVKSNVAFGTHGVRSNMPGDVKLEGVVPGISRLNSYNVVHLYGSPIDSAKGLSEADQLYLGLHLLAIHEPGREGALEVEGMAGKRSLVILGRKASEPLPSSASDGLQVVDLATEDDAGVSKKVFFEKVKLALSDAMRNIVDARVDAIKGDHCDWCDFGELCRRSRGFGEEDSPFDTEMEPEDG